MLLSLVPRLSIAEEKQYAVPLRWMLNVQGDHPQALPSIDTTGGLRMLRIDALVDGRAKGAQIGENTDRRPPVRIVTGSDVSAFIRDALTNQLRLAGVPLVDTDADRVLKTELLQFWAVGNRSYRADVRLRCTVTDAAGTELWSGVVGGTGENWGRALNKDNYNETFSNAVFELIVKLLTHEKFIATLRK